MHSAHFICMYIYRVAEEERHEFKKDLLFVRTDI